MAQTQAYPTSANILTYLTSQGVEEITENNTDFLQEFRQFVWQFLKRSEGAGVAAVYGDTTTTFGVVGGIYNWSGTEKTLTGTTGTDPTDNDTTYVWIDGSNAIQSAIDGTGWPATPHLKLAEVVVDSDGIITNVVDRRTPIGKLGEENGTGFVSVPLATLREVFTNDITNLAAHGGILAKDSTPNLEFANGDTDSSLQVEWASSNSDAVVFQTALPPDFDSGTDMTFHFRVKSGGTTDAVGFDLDTYFNEGDTKVSDSTTTNQTTSYLEKTATIANADIPSGAQTITIELTPVAHTTDTMVVSSMWIEYGRT